MTKKNTPGSGVTPEFCYSLSEKVLTRDSAIRARISDRIAAQSASTLPPMSIPESLQKRRRKFSYKAVALLALCLILVSVAYALC